MEYQLIEGKVNLRLQLAEGVLLVPLPQDRVRRVGEDLERCQDEVRAGVLEMCDGVLRQAPRQRQFYGEPRGAQLKAQPSLCLGSIGTCKCMPQA